MSELIQFEGNTVAVIAPEDLSELEDKALKYDLDQIGIDQRNSAAVELVEARAKIAELQEWQRQMVDLAASGGRLDAYREQAEKMRRLEEENERLRDEAERRSRIEDERSQRAVEMEVEIERLREEVDRITAELMRERGLNADKRIEIERLRELLRECIEWVEFKEDGGLRYAHGAPELVKRIRGALGE